MVAVIDRRKYDTDTATCLADDEFSDGTNRLSYGRCSTLYRTPAGRYFAHHETIWQGERDNIVPLTPEEAEQLYVELPNKSVSYETAFPDVVVEEA